MNDASKPKSRAPLLAAAGCGLLVLVVVCAGTGYWVFLSGGTSYDEFAAEANRVGEELLAATSGHPEGARDAFTDTRNPMRRPFTEPEPAQTEALRSLVGEDPERVLTAIPVGLVGTAGSVHVLAVVFPDGRVRFSGFEAAEGGLASGQGFPRTNEPARRLGSVIDGLREAGSEHCDDLTILTPDDLPSDLGADTRAHLTRGASEDARQRLCDAMEGGRLNGGTGMLGDVRVVARGQGRYAVLHSRMHRPRSSTAPPSLLQAEVSPAR
ncbi:MAG TPA: hypothetical protein RMH99_05620 [Sandaracinaceae bacterium LLY-WYZ-13_1]|nr:hypothetical protein [Sandaracinaceae bacterium LLY-WYZ-13_1]